MPPTIKGNSLYVCAAGGVSWIQSIVGLTTAVAVVSKNSPSLHPLPSATTPSVSILYTTATKMNTPATLIILPTVLTPFQ